MVIDAHVPQEARIYGWIEEVFGHGVRRPGYPADRWAEVWAQEQFRGFGLENVRAEPVEMPYWEPQTATLTVSTADGQQSTFECFPLPLAANASGLEGALSVFDWTAPDSVRGSMALCDTPLLRVPSSYYRDHLATWSYDPDGTFDDGVHVLPFSRHMQDVMEPAMEAGAIAFIGILDGYPGDSREYYVPYDGHSRSIPGVWIKGSDGARLRQMLAAGSVTGRLEVATESATVTSCNIVGELPGADDETVIIGSHHDGPWASAIEDSSGISLVLAQAAFWSKVPQQERPHRLVFLLNSGHMAGGAGQAAFVANHRAELERCVLEVHLEHTAAEVVDEAGTLRNTGRPEVRWLFTTRLNRLEKSVRDAVEAERLDRALMLKPDTFGDKPTTDGADFHLAGVPLVHYLVAPWYLFDSQDTLDKIHRPSLVPVTRAAIRIIESTRGASAAQMRADVVAT
jgi:hypothetical protein